jgi:hypothetical protein
MRWAFLFMVLAMLCALVVVLRGALVRDGLSLLAVAFVAAAFMSLWLANLAEKARQR